MLLATQTHYILPLAAPAVYALAALAVAAWAGSHWLKRLVRAPALRLAMFVGRTLLGWAAVLAITQVILLHLTLATNWRIWPTALAAAAAIEVILSLYQMERTVVSRPMGLALTGLRVFLVAIVIGMLLQPVRSWSTDHTVQRYVAVLLDNSASMYVPDTQLGASEKISLAQRFSADRIASLHGLDAAADELDAAKAELAPHAEWMATLSAAKPEDRQKALAARRDVIHAAVASADKKIEEATSVLGRPIDPKLAVDPRVRTTATGLATRLTNEVREPLKAALAATTKDNAPNLDRDLERLLRSVDLAIATLGDVATKTAEISQTLDDATYATLSPEDKGRINAAAAAKRIALARDVLLKKPKDGGKPLLDQLQGKWSISMHEFAAKPVEVNLKDWADPAKDADHLETASTNLPPDQQQTDLAGAVEKVMSDMADKQLSGILLLTDGRNNGPRSIEPLVQRLGVQAVPVSTVVFGGTKPPMDAAVISVEAPESLSPKDRLLATAEIKLDGLAGKEAKITLNDGAKVVDTKTVRVPPASDVYRTHVHLADEPATKGLHGYTVEVQSFDGEVLATNNKYPITVNVNEDRTNVLLIEGRPRWEFRYLKNLFSGRDQTVRLQYVLLEPDRLEGVPSAKAVEASASRPDGEVEAGALPKDETEWMKFDVIILGDVGPKYLKDEQLKILQRFVKDRSGTLIVIAGANFMPHAYAGTPLADVLPVVVKSDVRPYVPPPERRFRFALTSDGRESVITQMRTADEDNAQVWARFPDIYWRHPVEKTREGATVLAYALPLAAPEFLPRPAAAGDAKPETVTDDILRKRDAFARANPLIVYQTIAMGQSMFMASDMTWRLRYLAGDTYHHRLWGQVLKWAAAGKLPSGTDTVRLGTDRTRYAPQTPVRVKARIALKDYTPVNKADDITATVYEDDPSGAAGTSGKLILTKKMKYIENSPGMYQADLDAMPHGGAYRVEVSSTAVKRILSAEKLTGVSAPFSVDPTTPLEQAELVPDRGLLQRLAALTGGVVADPSHAERILASFGPPTETEQEKHEFRLWDSWPLLILMILAATGEWLLRKKGGLA
jgi:hypothetical protein